MRLLVGVLWYALGLAGLSSCARPAPEPVTPLLPLSFPPLDDSAGKWAPILSSPVTSYDVSLDGVERPTPTTMALWVRTVYKGNNNMLALGVGGAVTREEFDCARRRMRTRASSVFDRESTTVTSKTYARSLWFTPRRRSNYAYLLSEVCARLANESSADVPGAYRFAFGDRTCATVDTADGASPCTIVQLVLTRDSIPLTRFAVAAQRELASSRLNVGLDGVVPNACDVTRAAFSRWVAPTPSVGLAHWTWDTTGVVTVSLWRSDDSGAELRFKPGDNSAAGTLSTWTVSGPPPHADTGTVIVHREGSADVSVCNTSALIADSVRRAGM